MPLLDMIMVTSKERPSEWTLRTSKGRIIYVKFQNGKLSCRYDSRYTGTPLFNKDIKKKPLSSYMTTAEMLNITKFKLNHDEDYNSRELVAQAAIDRRPG